MNSQFHAPRGIACLLRPGRRQRGSLIVNFAIALSLITILLVGTELGYLFFMKREMQKAADLAALAGAQQISSVGGCIAAKDAAKLSANGANSSDSARNLPAIPISEGGANVTLSLKDSEIECGQWSPTKNTVDHFELASTNLNAVRVTIDKQLVAFLPFFEANRTLHAKAVAANDPIAGFSLGTGVASLEKGAINQLLGALLGTGNQITLELVSYKGLATGSIRLLDLISVLPNVGTVKELLDTRILLKDFILAMVKALGTNNAVAVEALNGILAANVRSVEIKVGDLIKVTTPSLEGAASANVNVLELLMVTAQVANGTNAVNLGTGVNLGALATVDTKLVVVEPPSIAIGEAGKDANGKWKTQAHSAAIRLFLDAKVLDTSKIPLVGLITNIQLVHLPLYIEVAPGQAWLTEIQCNNPRKDSQVTIASQPGIANICIANGMDTQMTNMTTPPSCSEPATISKISVVGIPLVEVKATIPLPATVSPGSAVPLRFDGIIGNADDIQRSNSNAVGSVLSTAVGGLTSGLNLKLCLLICLPTNSNELKGLLDTLNTAVITPLLGLLDTVVQPLLNLLGVQLGYSDVHHQSLTCGEAKLVY